MTHADRILEQLKQAEEDDDLPEDLRERCAEEVEAREEADEESGVKVEDSE